MKNIINKSLICIMLIITVFAVAGCSKTDTVGADAPKPIQAKLTEINMPFELEENQETGKALNMYTVCYAGSDILMVANVYDDITTATEVILPEVRTKGIYALNYKEGVTKLYDIESDNLIYSAVPYKDGILYVDSKLDDEYTEGERYKWNLVYFDKSEETVIDSGYSKNETATEITLVEETPVYVSERIDEGKTKVKVNKIVDMNIENIESFDNVEKHFNSLLENNGDSYLFNLYDAQDEKLIMCAGNVSEVYLQHTIEEVFNSSAITGEYVVASLGEETGKTKLVGIPLDGSDVKELEQVNRWWRMAGSSKEYCVAVDENFNPYYINIAQGIVEEIILPDEMEEEILVKGYHSIGNNDYILSINYETYYIMELD